MRISVCFGTLNRLELLKQTLDNILVPHFDTEAVVVDGGSTDGTVEFLKSYDRTVALFESGRTSYPDFMNKAFKAASGDLLVQWNDDAIMEPDGWGKLCGKSSQIAEAAGFRFPYKNTKTIDFNGGFKSPPWLSFGCYRRTTLQKYGLYHPDIKFYCCDTELCRRVQILAGENSLPYLTCCKVCHLDSQIGRIHKKKDKLGKADRNRCKQICQRTRKSGQIPSLVELLS